MNILAVNLTEWIDRWSIAEISVATVFLILFILVLVLWLFGKLSEAEQKHAAHAAASSAKTQPIQEDSAEDLAAVAMALYLYQNDAHDTESGVLTLSHEDSHWHSQLNPRI